MQRNRKEERMTEMSSQKSPVDEAYESLNFEGVYGVVPRVIKSDDVSNVEVWLKALTASNAKISRTSREKRVIKIPEWSPSSSSSSNVIGPFEEPCRFSSPLDYATDLMPVHDVHDAGHTPELWQAIQEYEDETTRSQQSMALAVTNERSVDIRQSSERVPSTMVLNLCEDKPTVPSSAAKAHPSTAEDSVSEVEPETNMEYLAQRREPGNHTQSTVAASESPAHAYPSSHNLPTTYYLTSSEDDIESYSSQDLAGTLLAGTDTATSRGMQLGYVSRNTTTANVSPELMSLIIRACKGPSIEHTNRSENKTFVKHTLSRLFVK
jgi:hypothetical protein